MPVICPKCSHVRPHDASNPDWQCPACGICYARFTARPPEPPRAVTVERQGVSLGWLFKVLLLVVLVLILKTLLERRQPAPPPQVAAVALSDAGPESRKPDPAIAFANATISASGVDGSMLHALSGRLERACARNKYGLSESACIARVRARESDCATRTARRFPGSVENTERMGMMVKAYVGCIFEED